MLKKKEAFTLIELMIVIAIIWILAVTIIPSLTWAQGRARDTGRKSNVKNAYTALITYQQDFAEFPKYEELSWVENCFSSSNWAFLSDQSAGKMMGELLSWKKAPLDPQKGRIAAPCGEVNAIWYKPLKMDDIEQASFALWTNVEAVWNANILSDSISSVDTVDGVGAASGSWMSDIVSGNKDNKNADLISENVNKTMYVKFYE